MSYQVHQPNGTTQYDWNIMKHSARLVQCEVMWDASSANALLGAGQNGTVRHRPELTVS
jgi:hypothetical protein